MSPILMAVCLSLTSDPREQYRIDDRDGFCVKASNIVRRKHCLQPSSRSR